MDARVDDGEARLAGEARWPMACAVLTVVVLTILLPTDQRAIPGSVLPLAEVALLGALIAGDPA
jgi:hypothetical protein